jgi:hypothetical protein
MMKSETPTKHPEEMLCAIDLAHLFFLADDDVLASDIF